ncbi:MAG TPA: hypothetical protein VHC43_06695 [Mycobacteriales bacterium]|nr:hypothetical protein [Mycobacteriales bacterium]
MSWSWTLLCWGAAIGVVGVLGSYLVGRRADLDPGRWRAYSGFVVVSGALALLAAGLDSAWPVIALAVYVSVAGLALPLVLLPRLRKPASHSCATESSCDATACATCPLASHAAAR